MKKNRIILVVVILLLVVGGYLAFSSNPSSASEVTSDKSVKEISLSDNERIRGNVASKVVIVEYVDFECPACGNLNRVWKQVWRIVQLDVKLVFRHFALPFHSYAKEAAVFAEAANLQDKFWEMEQVLFDNQEEWSEATSLEQVHTYFYNYAKQVGLDEAKMKDDIESKRDEFVRKIDGDIASGSELGVEGTPTVFINGEIVRPSSDPTSFLKLIKSYIKKTTGKE